jgi:hypothetical protein
MTTFTIIFASAAALWIVLTIFAACYLAKAADELYQTLKPKNRKAHRLGKWLRFHGKI